MCYSPITIVNPTKYVSLKYRDRYLLRVPCGHCAECQQLKQNEYYLRAFYHAQDFLSRSSSNFVLFDTLTYSNKYLPHISDFVSTKFNYPCFNSDHVRLFIARLRQKCKRLYKSNFDFMLSSEYGSSNSHQHRPHYHILFFVYGSIKPLEFSSLVSECWFYGRTDGIPYKSHYYVMNNVLNSNSAQRIRVLKYVSKYIAKSCLFYKVISKRVNSIMFEVNNYRKLHGLGDNWIDSLDGALYREKLMRYIGQFHRQSTGFGASLLNEIDLNNLFKTNSVSVYDNEKVILSVPLPMYYKRKLFYQQCEVDGSLVWVPTELGKSYLKAQQENLKIKLKKRYQASLLQSHLKTDITSLVDYVVDKRGRIIADLPESDLIQRLNDLNFYKYATRYDRYNLGSLGLVTEWLGNSIQGYNVLSMPKHITLFSFAKSFTFFDEDKEKILDQIDSIYYKIDKGKQEVFEKKQYLVNLYHYLLS